MANLKVQWNKAGNYMNSPFKELSASCDEDITSATINNILVNNGSNYNEDIKILPNCSQIIVMCKTYALVCIFDSNLGQVNSNTKVKDGEWKIISKIDFVTI